MEIGTKIKKVRELKNYTQEYMAQKLNVSQSTYSRYEKEDGDITISLLREISEIFGMKVDDLINFDEKFIFNNYGTAHDKSFSVNYQAVGDKERELYEKTIALLEDKIKYLESK
jgi:transcriptional regulator with XRE-family HTH domain